MSRVLVKICGLTRRDDVQAAIAHGADALGFVFALSPRRLDAPQAARLTHEVPRGIMRVGVFMDQPASEVKAVLAIAGLDLLQFHGAEDNAFCAAFGLPFLKAVSMLAKDPTKPLASFPDAAGFLLDSHRPGGQGGTGEAFDWGRRLHSDRPLWLAGGLHPGNVAQAVRTWRPHAVDVSSGVEDSPGIKNEQLIGEFIRRARQE